MWEKFVEKWRGWWLWVPWCMSHTFLAIIGRQVLLSVSSRISGYVEVRDHVRPKGKRVPGCLSGIFLGGMEYYAGFCENYFIKRWNIDPVIKQPVFHGISYLEDHPRTCNWLGSPPLIDHWPHIKDDPTSISWKVSIAGSTQLVAQLVATNELGQGVCVGICLGFPKKTDSANLPTWLNFWGIT